MDGRSSAYALECLGRTPVAGLCEKALLAHPLVVVYHALLDPSGLRRQIAFLASRYHVVDLDALVGMVAAGRTPPHGCAAVTFDDGLRSVFTVAYPILQDYVCPATVFVNTSAASSGIPIWPLQIRHMLRTTPLSSIRLVVNGATCVLQTRSPAQREEAAAFLIGQCKQEWRALGDDALERLAEATESAPGRAPLSDNETPASWDELTRMETSGLVRIGNHTDSHRILPGLGSDELRQELLEAHRLLQEHASHPSRVFCYPDGDTDPRAERILSGAGYLGAVTTLQWRVSRGTPAMRVPRIGAYDFESLQTFRARTSGVLTPVRYAAHLFRGLSARGRSAQQGAGRPA